MKEQTAAILLMAGKGTRFRASLTDQGSQTAKQFHRISGKEIYLHTLEAFLRSGFFGQIILVCPPEHLDKVMADTRAHRGLVTTIAGGDTRQASSLLGLRACRSDTRIVMIHDAVRPFVSLDILTQNLSEASTWGAIDTCIPCCDTIVHSQDQLRIAGIPKRSEYLRGQTPQTFSYPLILHAHAHALASGIQNASDDCALVLALGKEVGIVFGDEKNIKITTELDLFLAEQLFRLSHSSPSPSFCRLDGKTYAVTGALGEIGSALADLLEQQGARVIRIGRTTSPFRAHLENFEETRALFASLYEKEGELDGLVNGAGSFIVGKLSALSAQEIDSLIANNFTSLVYACGCARIKPGGHILNIASSSYARGRGEYVLYAAAKAAVVNFTQGLAEERPELRINAIAPQRTNTQMRKKQFPDEDPRELLSPQQVAEAALRLLMQESLTGAIVDVRL